MAKVTRRTFLASTSVGAATLGVLGAPLSVEAARGLSQGAATHEIALGASEPMMVYVRDAASGEVTFMMGTREVTRRDPALVARLLRGMM